MARWDGVEEFIAVAECASFVGAARKLALSTSHVSRAVARLETRLAAQLFFRTARRVSLTDTGRALLRQCRRTMGDLDEAFALASGSSDVQGELRVTCSSTMGERFVTPILLGFGARHPKLRIHLNLTNRIVDLVGEGLDVAIRTGNLPDSGLIAQRIGSRRLHLCAGPDYLVRAGRPGDIADLEQHACLVGTASHWCFGTLAGLRVFRPQPRLSCTSGMALVQAAVAGFGICQLPDFYVLPHIRAARLIPLLESFRIEDEPIWAVYSQQRHLQPKIREFVDCLRARLMPAINAG